jgi:hypothetical protein
MSLSHDDAVERARRVPPLQYGNKFSHFPIRVSDEVGCGFGAGKIGGYDCFLGGRFAAANSETYS